MRRGPRGPLRRIVDVEVRDHPRIPGAERTYEILECGHDRLRRYTDEMPRTARRHCRTCLREEAT